MKKLICLLAVLLVGIASADFIEGFEGLSGTLSGQNGWELVGGEYTPVYNGIWVGGSYGILGSNYVETGGGEGYVGKSIGTLNGSQLTVAIAEAWGGSGTTSLTVGTRADMMTNGWQNEKSIRSGPSWTECFNNGTGSGDLGDTGQGLHYHQLEMVLDFTADTIEYYSTDIDEATGNLIEATRNNIYSSTGIGFSQTDDIMLGFYIYGASGADNASAVSVPEPATIALLGLGALTLIRKRK